MGTDYDEWKEMLPHLYLLLATLGLAFSLWVTIFRELDYYEIKYAKKTKIRSLFVIWIDLFLIILWGKILWKVVQLL